jgi:hypothetical protein
VVENGSEKLIIKNLFDEQVVAEGILVPAKTLKQKASLEVNIEERKTDIVKDSIESNTDTLSLAEEVISDEQPIKDTTEVVRPKLIEKSDISNKEIIDMAYKDADALRKEASEMKNQAEIAYQIANQKNELAIQKNAEAEKLQNEGAPVENVKSLKTSSKEYAEQAIVAVTLAKEIEQKAIKKEEEAKLAFRYADEIESAINTSTAEEAAVKIEQLNQFLETQKQNQDADFAYNQFKTRLEEKQKSANNKIEYANKLNREVEEQEEDIKALKQEAEKSSKKDKERLLEQAAILENELPEMKEKARIAGEEANNAQSQLLVLEREESLLSSVITELKSTDTSFVAELSSAEKSELETKISKTEIELAKANADETYINNNTKSDSLASQNNSSNAKSEDKSLTTDSLSVQNKIADNMGKQADSAIVSIQPKDSALVKQNEPKTIEKQDSAIVSENINIENNDSDTLLLSNISLYSSKYIQTENEAKAITNLYDRAITLSDINKVWMEELENEITNLEKSKINIKNTEKLAKVDEVIRQLEKLSSEKRTAANNYKSEAENIRLKEALFADKDSVTIDYDTYFSNKIEVQSSQSDLTLSEKNKAIIYNAWADSLENEIAEIKQELAEAETEEDKSVLNEEIAQLEKEVNEKRILASGKQTLLASSDSLTVSENKINNTDTTSAVLSENLKGTSFADSSQTSTATESIIANQTFITPDVQLPATTSSVDFYNEASQLNEEYETNQAEAISLRQQAESTKNKSEKAQLLASAEEKEKLATEKQLEYTLALEKAEAVKSAEYQPISTVQQEKRQSAEWTEKSEALRAESESLNTKSAEIYAQAETTKNKKEKEALVIEANKLKQQSEIKQKEADNAQTIAQEVELIEKRKYLDAIVLNEKSRKQDTTQTTAIEPAEMDYVANALEYKIYEQNKKEYTKLYKEAEVLNTQSATYRKDAEDQERVAAALIAQSDEITNEDEKQKIIQEAEAIKAQAAVNRLKADSLSIVSNTKQNKADEMALKTIANLVSNDESMYEKALAYDAYKNRTTTKPVSDDTTLIAQNRINQADTISTVTNKAEEKIVADNSSLSDDNIKSEVKNNIQKDTVQDKTAGAKQDNKIISSIDYIPPVLKSEIFAPSDNPSVSAYSSSNPIPVDVKLPEGLVFKVQVGAFRNPIPQDVFKGFSPIVGEKVGDLTKYTAGFFVSFTNADIAKNKIRQLGYNDAFVVAYYNGKRISVTEARTMPASAVAEVASNVTKGTLNNPDSISQPKNIIADNINETSTASSGENVKAIKGLFFTVQIGVYSRLVSPEELKNVSYINFENLENGNIRYTSGRYSDIAPALEAKDNIVQKGIRDAFVTAYFNGKRITVAEARTIASSGAGRDLAVATNQINKDENSNNPENNASDNSGNILFKVQVGPYRGNVPNEHAGPILRFSSSGVEVGRDEAGATIYNFGSFSDFESAKRLKDEIFTGGLQNSTVVAYRNGRKMNLEEAKKQSGR